jgi:lipopolysaccharide export system permease protein
MKLLSRYFLSEVVQVFVLALIALTTLFILVGVGKEAYNNGLTLWAVVRLMPYLLPTALLFGVPAALLFAVTTAFGRMSAAGEIIALKALGIGPSVVLFPVGVLAVVLSLVTFWLNDIAFSWGDIGTRQVIVDSFEEIAYGVLRTKGSFRSQQFSVDVRRVEGRRLINPTFSFKETSDSPVRTLTAEEAELRSIPGTGVLKVLCRNAELEVDGGSFEISLTFEREIQLADQRTDPYSGASPSRVPLSRMPEKIAQQRVTIDRMQQEAAAQTGWRLVSGDFAGLAGPEASEQNKKLDGAKRDLARMRTESPRRWANGFSCLVFAMVGVPIAILRRYSDTWASFFVCFLPILIIYYPLMAYGVERAKVGALPPMIVWLGNVVLASWGLWLLRRVYRY